MHSRHHRSLLLLLPALLCGLSAQPPLAQGREGRVTFETPKTVKVKTDLAYADRPDTKLDLYLPSEPIASKPPLIIVIHGGGWVGGDKSAFQPMAAYLAEQGFAAASVNYGLLPDVEFPTNIQHCKAAVRWLRAEAKTYGYDPDKIGVIGGSAGAHLGAMLATSPQVSELEGSDGNEGVSSEVQAFVGMATPVDMERYGPRVNISDSAMLELVSPDTHVSKDSPPTLLMHGTRDGTVPLQHSRMLQKALQAKGVSAEFVTFEGAPHAFWNFTQWFGEAMTLTSEFFAENLK